MIKSPAAYVEFKNLQSHAGTATKQRIRPTVTGSVVVVLEEVKEGKDKENPTPRFSMGKWMMQFARYSTALMVVDPECAQNSTVFSRYQLEIGYLADESSCRDALEADAKYRRSISKRVMSGIPLWSCFTEGQFRSFFDRCLSEAAGRKAYRDAATSSWSYKGKGYGKGSGKGVGKAMSKGGMGPKGGSMTSWSSSDNSSWHQTWGPKDQNIMRGSESHPQASAAKKTKAEGH
ncbi:hypothetical protein Pmar_PMAR027441 [Perkinsus marinus ATCC 50983]|uniref:Uncharacterized protein n=1 Tax=Perkinsus marinus (strain ATCC 50983 / TXsc) TaxID=423536 RepID=C5LI13_PERM5|nr:hypothetical protein Pmar_PMAR027441 [Perkinsus marinus ATCC 50983]EER03630.1 hypothetical protein Pmar_PMAR027441 [Perkinsus marinus ATCC 50983]|eukprot:XP_002771814.1 hypothetical protein Pmar_PMAR027441 [Perkinsus marinus ATCC 50983]